jgi:hypothetical protein
MQSALVKLIGNLGLFTVKGEDKDKVRIHPQDKMCLLVDAGEVTSLKDGSIVEDGIISANQTVLIRPNVSLVPHKYHALVSYTSEFALRGALVSPIVPIVRPGEKDAIGLIVRASKKIDLAELGYVFSLYQID